MDHNSAFNQLPRLKKKQSKIKRVTEMGAVFQEGFDTLPNEKAFKHQCLKAFNF